MKWRDWIVLLVLLMLFATPVRAYAGEILDLPPIDISQGDWWVGLLVWYLMRYRQQQNGPGR